MRYLTLFIGLAMVASIVVAAPAKPEIQPIDRYPYPPDEVYSAAAGVSVKILKSGRPETVYRDGGYHWIEGRRGERFAYHIVNHNGFPIGAIPSADGQSLTADGRARPEHPAYVIAPYSSQTISIWREDLRGGRALVFTDVKDSLAALKGDRRNIGVLGVLVWRLEDKSPPVPMERDDSARAPDNGPAGGAARQEAPAREGIGVGAGERLQDNAYLTDRYRRVRVLDTIALYYDDRPGLLRAGVDLDQYRHEPPYIERRESQPFSGSYREDDYQGVRIPG